MSANPTGPSPILCRIIDHHRAHDRTGPLITHSTQSTLVPTVDAGVADRAAARLPLPDAVDPGAIRWIYAVPIVALHALALAAALPWLFSWTGLIVMVLGVHVFGQSINICYHRQLTHQSFVTSKWLEHLFVILALCGMQDSPGRWVANHRYHHQHSDAQPDPHSPLVSFFWAHVGWLLARNSATAEMDMYRRYARDILADPFYMKLEKNRWLMFYIYVAHAAAIFALAFAAGWVIDGNALAGLQFGLSVLVWGVFVRTVVVWHITWSVNSLTHLVGYRNHATDENSRNSFFVALITLGEGWHNNHHHDQTAASNQHRWWELDAVYYQIKLLGLLGLARNIVPLRKHRIARAQALRNESAE